jgi:hypothetical protein
MKSALGRLVVVVAGTLGLAAVTSATATPAYVGLLLGNHTEPLNHLPQII